MIDIDAARQRREFLRWVLLLGLNNARPIGAWQEVLLSIARGVYPDATRHEVRLELDYLSDRTLVTCDKQPDGRWFCELTRTGVDLVEYVVPCEPGIARPEKMG